MDIFDHDGLPFARAPHPGAWMESVHAAELEGRAGASIDEQTPELRVLTYNTGLLRRWYAFIITEVPHYAERREELPQRLFAHEAGPWDVILLQEVWETEDADAIESEAHKQGYFAYAGTESGHIEHGLMILVREDRISDLSGFSVDEHHFELQRKIESYPGPGVRTAQAREIALASKNAGSETLALVGGDFNGMAYYPLDRWGVEGGEPVTQWWQNASMYALLQHYGDLRDAWIAVHPPVELEILDQLPEYSSSWTSTPYGDASWCEQWAESPESPFSAVDCNGLHLEQYGGSEYPGRIDLMTFRDPLNLTWVEEAQTVFTEVLDWGGAGAFELSDHYGVSFTLALTSEASP
jgi:hypothetical protein